MGTIENAVKKYNDKDVHWSPQGMLKIEPSGMRKLFTRVVDHIKQTIGDVINNPEAKGQLVSNTTNERYNHLLVSHTVTNDVLITRTLTCIFFISKTSGMISGLEVPLYLLCCTDSWYTYVSVYIIVNRRLLCFYRFEIPISCWWVC